MEDAVRTFAEECDSLQGLQLAYDTAASGAFTASLLTAFRDEYAKLSILAFPLLSDAMARPLDVDDVRSACLLVFRDLNRSVSASGPKKSLE